MHAPCLAAPAASVRSCCCYCCSQVEATALGTTNMSVNSSGSTLGSAPYTKNLMRLLNRCVGCRMAGGMLVPGMVATAW